MAVRIRLKRFGRKGKPFYRLVVADSQTARNGKTIEEVGVYDPCKDPVQFQFKSERVQHWLSVGAKPSEPVYRLLSVVGLVPAIERVSKEPGVSKKEIKARGAK